MPDPTGQETPEERRRRQELEALLAGDAEGWLSYVENTIARPPDPVGARLAYDQSRDALWQTAMQVQAMRAPMGADDPLASAAAEAITQANAGMVPSIPERPTLWESYNLATSQRVIAEDGRPLSPAQQQAVVEHRERAAQAERERVSAAAKGADPFSPEMQDALELVAEDASMIPREVKDLAGEIAYAGADWLRNRERDVDARLLEQAEAEYKATGRRLQDVPVEETVSFQQALAAVPYNFMPYGVWPSMDRRWAILKAKEREAGFEAEPALPSILEGMGTPPHFVEGFVVESRTARDLRVVGSATEALIVETIGRIPIGTKTFGWNTAQKPLPPAPTDAPWAELADSEVYGPTLEQLLGEDASPAVRAKAALELENAGRAASNLLTVSEVVFGVTPGELQRIDRSDEPFPADWAQGILESIERGEGIAPYAALAAERRLGPEWTDHGYAFGTAMSFLIPWEGMAIAPLGRLSQAADTVSAARAAGARRGSVGLGPLLDPEFDVSDAVYGNAMDVLERRGTEAIPDPVLARAQQIALTEDGIPFEDIAFQEGYAVGAALERRADLDQAAEARAGATPGNRLGANQEEAAAMMSEAARLEQRAAQDMAIAEQLDAARSLEQSTAAAARGTLGEAWDEANVRFDEFSDAARAVDQAPAQRIAGEMSAMERLQAEADAAAARVEGREATVARAQGRAEEAGVPVAAARSQADEARALRDAEAQRVRTAGAEAEAAAARAATPVILGEVQDPGTPFVSRTVRRRLYRQRIQRPEPPLRGSIHTENQYWQAVREANARRNAATAPLGYDLPRHHGWRSITGAADETVDDLAYILRDGTGQQIGPSGTFAEKLEQIAANGRDGDIIFREGSERTVARWNRVATHRANVELVSDWLMTSPAEAAEIAARRTTDPRLRPQRLRQLRRSQAQAERAEELVRIARERSESAASARAAVEAALEDQATAERLLNEAEQLLQRQQRAEANVRGQLTRAVNAREAAVRDLARAQAEVDSFNPREGNARQRARAAATRMEELRRAQEAADAALRGVMAAEREVEAARLAAGEAGTLFGRRQSAAFQARAQANRIRTEAQRLIAEADAAVAAAGAREVLDAQARATAGASILNRLVGGPGPRAGAVSRTEQIVRDASNLVARDAMPGGVLRMLPNGSMVPRRTYARIMSRADETMGVTSVPSVKRRFRGAQETLARAAAAGLTEEGVDLRAGLGALDLTVAQERQANALIGLAERAGIDLRNLHDLTPAIYDALRTQAITEAGGVWASARYSTRATEPFVNRVLRELRRPSGQRPPRGIVEMFRAAARAPLGAFATNVAEGLTPRGRVVWDTLLRRLETFPDEMVRAWQRADGTAAERMVEVVGEYGVPHPEFVRMAAASAAVEGAPYPTRLATALATRDRLRELWPPGTPRPAWLDSPDDQVFWYGHRTWTRNMLAEAANYGRQWVVNAVEASGHGQVTGPAMNALRARVDDAMAARIYEEVFERGRFDGPALAGAVATPPQPGTNAFGTMIYLGMMRMAGESAVRSTIRDLLANGLAIASAPVTSTGRLTVEAAIVDVLNDRHRSWNARRNVWESEMPDGIRAYAEGVLREWGIEPGSGSQAIAYVTTGGRRIVVPASLAETLEKAAALADQPLTAAGLGTSGIGLQTPVRAWKRMATMGVLPVPFTPLYNPEFFAAQLLGNYPLLLATRGLGNAIRDGSLGFGQNAVMVGHLIGRHWGASVGGDVIRLSIPTRAGTLVTPDELFDAATEARLFDALNAREVEQVVRAQFDQAMPATTLPGLITRSLRMTGAQLLDILPRASAALEQQVRLSTMLNLVRDGVPVRDAARRAMDVLPNYHAMTDFEKSWMRTFIPFYAFLRKSSDAYGYALLTNPSRVLGQVRLARASQQEKFESEIERGGLSDEQLARMVAWSTRDMFDQNGNWNPYYAQYSAQTTPVGISDFFLNAGLMLHFGQTMTSGSDEQRRAIGLLNPWLQAATIWVQGRKPTGEFSRRDLRVPRELLISPLGEDARALFCVGPRQQEPWEDPRMADPDATAAMSSFPGGANGWVWAAGQNLSCTPDENKAAIRNWMMFQAWMGRQVGRLGTLGPIWGTSPAPPELSPFQLVAGEMLGTRWSPTYSELAYLERYWTEKQRAAEEATKALPATSGE